MVAIKLPTIRVEKPWGRHQLGAGFGNVSANQAAIGEIWFEPPSPDDPLLVKYLFTSEKLSIQVHPNDEQARTAGHKCGKEECWIVLETEPDARIGLGTVRPLDAAELRTAVLDGSIEGLMDWKVVHSGDVIYVPSGTVHAIGAGVTLVEIQQNVDLTYRLFDYGRPRELHLDLGIEASQAEPFVITSNREPIGAGREILVQGRKFVIERWTWSGEREVKLPFGVDGLFVPLNGDGLIDGQNWVSGECWLARGNAVVAADGAAEMLFAYSKADPLPLFAGA